MNKFKFISYRFEDASSSAHFLYESGNGQAFHEAISFRSDRVYDVKLLDKALFLAFILIGTSYYKAFPTYEVDLQLPIDGWQADFFNKVYQEGLGQFAFENNLTRDDLANFTATSQVLPNSRSYDGSGILLLQSGGKDSLLLAKLLQLARRKFTSWYLSSGEYSPGVLGDSGEKSVVSRRRIDRKSLEQARRSGAKNGHVPVTYIVESLAIIQAILLGKSDILTSIAHEGEEPHYHIGDLAVTHQWSKTWLAENAIGEYVSRYISPDIRLGSPIRNLSELRVAELFVNNAWGEYGHKFSSCNVANYKQGADNTNLSWCGQCPKCANSYLLFAPFVEPKELTSLFMGRDLFKEPALTKTFKGLLGIDGEPKPFECIGEVDELRLAYHMSQAKGGYHSLPFEVPESSFDYMHIYEAQEWAVKMLQ